MSTAVTLHLWAVPAARVPGLVAWTTGWRLGRRGHGFAKLLGATRPGRLDLRAADPRPLR